MFRRPDVYQLGIAVAPKPQAHLYNAWFQEIYMQTRETNADGYEQSAAINFAEGLGETTSTPPSVETRLACKDECVCLTICLPMAEGDLLIVHGTGETNTHLEIVEGLVDRLVQLGKPFDYMVSELCLSLPRLRLHEVQAQTKTLD